MKESSFILLLTLLHLSSGDLIIGCFTDGICENGDMVGYHPSIPNPDECLSACKDNTNCNYFTYQQYSEICFLYSSCDNLQSGSCPDCVSGDSSCSAQPCYQPGQCLGRMVHFGQQSDMNACRLACGRNPDCEYFTFDGRGNSNLCLMTDSCSVDEDGCPGCVHGSRECNLQSQGFSKILLKIGYFGGTPSESDEVDMIDLSRPDPNCAEPANLPIINSGMAAALIDNVPWFCSGGYGNTACFKYDSSANRWTTANASLSVPRHSTGSAMVRGGALLWITGGVSDYSSPDYVFQKTTEFLRDGKFVPGPDLPEALKSPCLVNINNTHVFLAGGHNGFGSSNRAYIINLDNALAWHRLPNMSHNSVRPSCGLITTAGFGDEILVTGADGGRSTEIYSLSAHTWRSGPEFPIEIHSAGNLPYQDSFLMIGGGLSGGGFSDKIYKFNVREWRWDEFMQKISQPSQVVTAVLVPDELSNCSKKRKSG